MKILIADDDPAIRKIVSLYFEKEGFQTATVSDGETALDLLCETPFDLAVLDWMMPGLSGPQLCGEIRKLQLPVKTLLLTARTTADDEIRGLSNGANEYIRKPFDPTVLIIRAKKLLCVESILSCRSVTLNPASKRVEKDGKELILSKKEYDLLEFFLKNQGVVLTRDALLNQVWGADYDGDERTVDTHVKRLRAKIGEGLISTRRGLGYCMERQT